MRHPFAAVVLSYAAGLLLGNLFHPSLALLFASAAAILLLAIIIKNFRRFLIWPFFLVAGWINLSLHTTLIAPDDLRVLTGNDPALVTVRGHLAQTPRLRMVELGDRPMWHSVVSVRVEEIQTGGNNFPVRSEVMVNTAGVLGSEYFAGQSVEIRGVIAQPPGPLAEGLFDYRQFLADHGMYRELKAQSTNDWKIIEPRLGTPPLTDRFLHWSQNTLAQDLPPDDENLHLLWAMTLGWRTALTADVSDPFLQAGTMHLFAIDGLRIALLSGIIVAFLRMFRLSRGWCGAIAVPVIWFYTAATGWEPPAVRASVMMTIVLGGWALNRPGDLQNSLSLAAFIILVQDPRQLFEAGFQLSFFVVLVIGLMLPPMNDWINRVVRHDPLLPESLVPGWRGWLLKGVRRVAQLVALSFAAWIGSLPLSAEYFHLFSPVSTLANVVAVPCGALALTANLASLMCGAWFPALAGLFNHAAWFFMWAMTGISEVTAKIPGAYFYIPAPPVALVIIYYVVLIAFLSRWFSNRWRKWLGILSLVGLMIAGVGWWVFSLPQTKLTVLPLNGGHAVLVDAAGRHNDWLMDCGNAAAVDFTLKSFLRAQGVNRVPHLILTEGDEKNCGGATTLAGYFPVDELLTSNVKFRSPAYRAAISNFEKPPARHQLVAPGQTIGNWQVLFPNSTNIAAPRADDNAMVILGTFSGIRILSLSDLGRDGQSTLLSNTNDLHADIVITGLPEKGEPLCDDLLAAIHPRLIIVADSGNLLNRHASPALKQRLAQINVPVIYTRDSGAVTIETQPAAWAIRTMDGQRFNSNALNR